MENIKSKTKILSVINLIKSRIDDKSLLSGSKLPSLRKVSNEMGVSVSTVVEAYDRLISEDIIESRPGAGYFVKGLTTHFPIIESIQNYDREVDPLWISRQSFEANADTLKPGCGWLPNEWLPEEIIRKAIRKVSSLDAKELLSYSSPLGHQPLRELICRRLQIQGSYIHPEQIMLTDCGTQAIDIICRLYLKPGDVVLIDDPCYFNFHALLNLSQTKIIAIPFTKDGPDVEAFRNTLSLNPKLYITNSGIHNPTGASLSVSTAHQILKFVEQANMLIIEDDIFADFELAPAPRYAALSAFKHVVQIGSFSKSLSGSLRCGYIAAKPELIEHCIKLRIATNLSTNYLNSTLIYHALSHSQYRKHLDYIHSKLTQSRINVMGKLLELDIKPWVIPKAGIFLWCKLPHHIDTTQLSQAAFKHNIILAPGNVFSQSTYAKQYMRFNVAQCQHQKIFDVLEHFLIKT
ncbi:MULTISPECIES: aminotransferase-like domain-containing protein [Acinetobacter]|uniref:aminotransferase-like domain-containing protein n=1 Tax=Acinetobacter TaxID=469 RepID=UPI0021CD4EB9|nr:PLP-dependent aminotransferase family protein [Acinetobacter haemolyticus]MCU4379619.1 PLP-dependent aminotransferase family protein [Acinetobacter haemolyticus]